ncbi:MAG: alpha/beta hydrolase [Miltoncostaeaceae bacterium]
MTLPEPHRVSLDAPDGTPLSALHWSAEPGRPAVLIVHGWQSRGANHVDFAERCAARGWAVLVPDLRGHGDSEGAVGPEMVGDVVGLMSLLLDWGHPRIALRGSSMGGLLGLHAAAQGRAAAVAAICPARPDRLGELLQADWPRDLPLRPAVSRGDGVARGYWHATGDERVPWQHTLWLSQSTPHPMRLRVALGGHHGSLQHDPGVQEQVVDFLAEHLER